MGKLEGVGEGSIVGVLLGDLVGNFVGTLLGMADGVLLGARTGARVGVFDGVGEGRLLGEDVGEALGASHTPHRALQFALTDRNFAHLSCVRFLAAQSQYFSPTVGLTKNLIVESTHSVIVDSKGHSSHVTGQYIIDSSKLQRLDLSLDTHWHVFNFGGDHWDTLISNFPSTSWHVGVAASASILLWNNNGLALAMMKM